jgi:hypothetical protein
MAEKALQVIEKTEIETKNIEVGEWGLDFKGQLSTEEWLDAVIKLQKFDGKIQWYLGDLAVYAESPTTGWGESKYSDLIDATGYSYQTLAHFAKVARRFTSNGREKVFKQLPTSANISFSHFVEVAPLDDNFAFYWLEKAAKNGWGVSKLRDEIRKWKDEKEGIIDAEEEDENEYEIPTFAQVTKEMATWAKNYAKDNSADFVRIQIIKGDKVIDEKTTEVY